MTRVNGKSSSGWNGNCSGGHGHLCFPAEDVDPPPILAAAIVGEYDAGVLDAPVTPGLFHPQPLDRPAGIFNHTGSASQAPLQITVGVNLRSVGSAMVDAFGHGIVRLAVRYECGNDLIDHFGFRIRPCRIQLLFSFRPVRSERLQDGTP